MSTLQPVPRTRRFTQVLVAALAVWACVAAVSVVVPAARADLAIIHTRWQIDQWASGKAPMPGIVAWGKARSAVSNAISITPEDPQLHEHMAYLYASRAQQARAVLPDLANTYLTEALRSYERAAALRPMDGSLWANMALAHHSLYTGELPADDTLPLWQAFDKAMAYGQREPSVQATLAEVGFARWAVLAEPRRSALLSMLALAGPHALPAIEAAAQRHGRADLLPQPEPQPAPEPEPEADPPAPATRN